MTLRVAIIIERADVGLGGAERSMSEVAAALSQAGMQTDLLAAKGTATADDVRILCSDSPGERTSMNTFEQALKRHLAQNRYDIVHSVLPFDFADVYQPRGGTYAETVLRNAASYSNGAMRVLKRLTAFANLRRSRLLKAERRLCQGTNGPIIAALSQYVVDQLQTHYGTDPKRIALIPNGVAQKESVDPKRVEYLRSQIGANDYSPLLLFVAHNFRLKGLAPLIRALRLAVKIKKSVGLVVVGAGRTGPYRYPARRLGIEKQIAFLGPVRDVQNVLAICDVAVLPTYYDPASRFTLEALAAGKPVITTRYNGAADQFTHGRHGWVIDSPDNTQALADALIHVSDPANVQKAKQAIAEDRIGDRLSTARVAADLRRLYESILRKKGTL
jgi:UDP-glucose:(heptosyl)LPS alpha-1,3-glucosyltransferase